MRRCACLILLLTLAACSYIDTQWDHAWHPPTIPSASPGPPPPDPQTTPELDARAAAEREDPIQPPAPRPVEGYPNLASVPARPQLPTAADVAAARTELEAEQASGAAVIAGEDFRPVEKPRPAVAATTLPADPASPSLPVPPSNFGPPLYGQAVSSPEFAVFSNSSNVNLPQSQTIDAPDLYAPPP